MSLILDALRKMELERKAKRHGSAPIRTEVLNYRSNPSPPGKSRFLPAIAVLLLLAGAASFLFLKHAKDLRTEPVTAVVPESASTPSRLPMPQAAPTPVPPAQPVRPAVNSRTADPDQPAVQGPSIQPNAGDDSINISGIAWQEERSLRRAVINGSLLGEGADVLGAKIVEIKENRVRFNRGGTTFEISYP